MAGLNPVEHMKPRTEKVLGNYRARVEDVDDPLQSGRIRARVFPVFANESQIPVKDLPWAVPAEPLNHGAYSSGSTPQDCGSRWVPDVGAWVWVFFEAGEWSQPVYWAAAPAMQNSVPDGPRLSREKDDTTEARTLALSKDVPGAINTTHWDEPDPAWNAKYPSNRVTKTKAGLIEELDDTPGAVRRAEYHPSGTNREVRDDGTSTDHVKGDRYEVTEGNVFRHIKGRLEERIDGNAEMSIAGNLFVKIEGHHCLLIVGNMTVRSSVMRLEAQLQQVLKAGDVQVIEAALAQYVTSGDIQVVTAALAQWITSEVHTFICDDATPPPVPADVAAPPGDIVIME